MTDRVADIWGTRTPHAAGTAWPVRVDQYLAPATPEADVTWYQSACVLCSNGCGMDVGVRDGRIVGVRGRAADRVNRGRLGPKGLFGWQTNHAGNRLTEPLIRHDGQLPPATWDAAMELILVRSRQVLNEQGRPALTFHTSGQHVLEGHYTIAPVARGGRSSPDQGGGRGGRPPADPRRDERGTAERHPA